MQIFGSMDYWSRNQRLVVQTIVVWALVSYVLPLFVESTNEVRIVGFPLGYYLCSQLILVFYVAWIFLFSYRQGLIDSDAGAGESGGSSDVDSTDNSLFVAYGVYTGGFALFVVFLGCLEASGVGERPIGILYVVFTLLLYACIGVLNHTKNVNQYFVAGQNVPPVLNGMATAADWMSGASFVGLAGTLYTLGYDGLAFVVGWTGGYVLVATLIAPYLRKFQCFTVASFVAARYQAKVVLSSGRELDLSVATRLLAILVSVCCSFTYLTAQVYSTGIIMTRFIGVQFEHAVIFGLCGVLVCSMLGGMRAVTWTQVAQYIILIIAYLIPAIGMSLTVKDGSNHYNPIPQLGYGGALRLIEEREREFLSLGLAASVDPYAAPKQSRRDFFMLSLCLMVGTASLPHVLMRYFTTPTVHGARRSVSWSLLFIFVLYVTAPAYAAFSKLEVYQNVIGKPLDEVPGWIFKYGAIGLTKVCEKSVASVAEAVEACHAENASSYVLQLKDLVLNKDAIVIATPEIAGMPYFISGLVAAGGLSAALSTADGLLLAITNAFSHDIYYTFIDKDASPFKRLLVSRVLLLIIAAGAAGAAASKPADILSMVAWAFSLAAAGNFPALFLGIWWSRANAYGCIAGQVCGFGVTVFYLVATRYGGMAPWWGVANLSSGIFGLPVGLFMNIAVSLVTPPPPQHVHDMVMGLRASPGAGCAPPPKSAEAEEADVETAIDLNAIGLKIVDTKAETIGLRAADRKEEPRVADLPGAAAPKPRRNPGDEHTAVKVKGTPRCCFNVGRLLAT